MTTIKCIPIRMHKTDKFHAYLDLIRSKVRINVTNDAVLCILYELYAMGSRTRMFITFIRIQFDNYFSHKILKVFHFNLIYNDDG